jgi:XTP/dITP diphosphohydrolase
MRRFTGTELLVATHNQGKLEEIAHLLGAFRDFRDLGQGPRSAGARGNRHDLRRERADQGACGGQGHGAARPFRRQRDRDRRIGRRARVSIPPIGPKRRTGGTSSWRWNAPTKRWRQIGAPEPRTARFCCTLVLAWPDGHDEVFPGTAEGRIVWPMRGEQGHGYDPIFQPDGHDITFGEMDRWEKNRISHRADAFAKLVKIFGPA